MSTDILERGPERIAKILRLNFCIEAFPQDGKQQLGFGECQVCTDLEIKEGRLYMPKVSVIIPTHNRAEFLRSAITSVLNQTFQDFEIIIVDDASKDHTQEVIAHFNDARIKVIYNQVSKEAAGARNTGLMNANCEYIAFLDDDDEWLPEKLKMQTSLLDNSPLEVGGVCTGHFEVEKVRGRVSICNPEINDFSKDNFITTSSVLLRRECFEKCGLFDESMPTNSDYDMWIRISKSFSFKIIKKALVNYYIHENRLTFNHEKKARGLEILFEKYDDLFKKNYKRYSKLYLDLGMHYCYEGEMLKGRKAFSKSIRMNPFEMRNYFNFVLSLFGAEGYKKLKKAKEKMFMQ
jgi:glycosyltransferase involved in cell wall biosynthesis